MSLVMGWVSRSRSPRNAASNRGLLYYPTSLLIVGVVTVGMGLGMAMVMHSHPVPPNATWVPLAFNLFFMGFALAGAYLILEYVRVRHSLEPGGLKYQKPFADGGRLRWNEVARVDYSQSQKWFRIDTTEGEVVRVSALLVGLPEFARAVLDEVPAEYIDIKTMPILEQTAAGS